MANQIVVSAGAKVRNLQDVIIGTSGVLTSLGFDVANGVPRLDVNGKILVSQLPNSVMEYKGTWSAATNTPTLVNGTGNQGDVYLCNVAGTVDFGAGAIAFFVGDQVIYSGSIWQRASGATGTVTSVAVTESGDSLNITGSPITTSGTINIGFNGTNLQYVNGAGNLTTFPTLITSIGLSMPSAFSVANSPLTANGTIAVTGAGVASQYIRGDGTLADFPSSGGGGSSVSYYLNGGTSQGTISGTTYYEMSKTAVIGTGVDFAKSGDGFIVAFLTDANDPAQLNIPAGNWNYEIYAQMSSNGGTPQMYAELYKYDGTTFTLISTSSNEILYDGTALNLYTFAMAVPATSLTLTDRLAVKLYATNSGGKTTTVHTQDGHLCQIITTFSTGITALNGLTAQVQYFQTGTSGTDFNISSTTATHTFNLPTASAANRGALSSADWTTFNNKQSALTNPITGTGTSGQVAYFNGTSSLTSESNLFWDATNDRLGIGTASPTTTLDVSNSGNGIIRMISTGSTSSAIFRATNNLGTSIDIRQIGGSQAGNTLGVPSANLSLLITGGSLAIGTGAAFDLTLGTNNAANLTIKNGGNVLINTQTDAGFRLDVNGTARVQSDMIVNTITVGRGGGAVSTNTALGYQAGNANTTGNNNFFGGYLSGALNTTAGGNTYLGAYAGANGTSNVNNSNNTYVGMATGYSVGGVSSSNIMIGYYAGRYITGGVTEQTLTNFSIFIGDNTKALANNQTNQIVIGSSATGLGSNTTVIGNSSTTFGRWYGRLLLGTSTDAGYGLDINGTARVQTSLTVGTTAIISTEQAIISNSAAQQLRLFNTGTTAGTQAQLTFTTNLANTSSAIAAILLSSGNQTLSFFTPNAGTVAEKLRIWNNGNVLIQNGGTFTDTGFLFDVNGTARIQTSLTVGTTSIISTEQAIISNNATQQLRLYNSSTTAGAQAQLTFTTNTNSAVSSGISAISLDNSGNQTLSFLTSNTGTVAEKLRIWNTGNVHIQNGGTYTDVASSILTMNSTTKGFLPPRMTTTQRTAISSPAEGLIVVQTDGTQGLYLYIGAAWHSITML